MDPRAALIISDQEQKALEEFGISLETYTAWQKEGAEYIHNHTELVSQLQSKLKEIMDKFQPLERRANPSEFAFFLVNKIYSCCKEVEESIKTSRQSLYDFQKELKTLLVDKYIAHLEQLAALPSSGLKQRVLTWLYPSIVNKPSSEAITLFQKQTMEKHRTNAREFKETCEQTLGLMSAYTLTLEVNSKQSEEKQSSTGGTYVRRHT